MNTREALEAVTESKNAAAIGYAKAALGQGSAQVHGTVTWTACLAPSLPGMRKLAP